MLFFHLFGVHGPLVNGSSLNCMSSLEEGGADDFTFVLQSVVLLSLSLPKSESAASDLTFVSIDTPKNEKSYTIIL